MEEQLPISILELLGMHIYLSSITLGIGIIVLFILMQSDHQFSWVKYITKSIQLLLVVIIVSFLIWVKWPFGFDIMLGPINLPTSIIIIIFLGLYSVFKPKYNW